MQNKVTDKKETLLNSSIYWKIIIPDLQFLKLKVSNITKNSNVY